MAKNPRSGTQKRKEKGDERKKYWAKVEKEQAKKEKAKKAIEKREKAKKEKQEFIQDDKAQAICIATQIWQISFVL